MLFKVKEIIFLFSGEEGVRFFWVIIIVKKKIKIIVVKFEVNKLVNSVILYGNIEMRLYKIVFFKVINRSYKWVLMEI